MGLSEAEELEMLELENDNALAVQSSGQTDNPFKEFSGMSLSPKGIAASFLSSAAETEPYKAIATNDPISGFANNAMRGLIPAVTGTLGAGGGAAFGFGVGAIPATGILAAAGEAGRQMLVNSEAVRLGKPVTPALEGLGNIAEQGVMGSAAKYAEPIVAGGLLKAGGAIGRGAESVVDYLGTNLAGIKPWAQQFAKEAPDAVRKFIGAGPEAGENIANAIRSNVGKAVEAGENAYRQGIKTVLGDSKYGPGFRVNIRENVGSDLAQIKKDFGYGLKDRFGANGRGANYYRTIDRILQQDDVDLETAYYLQRDLNNVATDNAGTTLGVAFGRAADKLGTYLGTKVPELGAANSAYSAAKTLEREASRLTRADDVVSFATRVLNKADGSLMKEQLKTIGQWVPEVGKALDDALAYSAAQQVGPAMRSLPQTGMGASIAEGFVVKPLAAAMATQYATGSPLMAAGVAAGMAAKNVVSSPLANFYAMRGVQAAQGPIFRVGAAASEAVEKMGAPLLQQAYQQTGPAWGRGR
jgi:hypothetical protein